MSCDKPCHRHLNLSSVVTDDENETLIEEVVALLLLLLMTVNRSGWLAGCLRGM